MTTKFLDNNIFTFNFFYCHDVSHEKKRFGQISSEHRRDSHKSIRANRFAENLPIFITFGRFARIPSNLRFAIFSALKRNS